MALLHGNVARISPSEVGVSSAAPAAWTTRKATSIATLVAAPHAAEAATNTRHPEHERPLAPVALGDPAEQDQECGVHDRVAR